MMYGETQKTSVCVCVCVRARTRALVQSERVRVVCFFTFRAALSLSTCSSIPDSLARVSSFFSASIFSLSSSWFCSCKTWDSSALVCWCRLRTSSSSLARSFSLASRSFEYSLFKRSACVEQHDKVVRLHSKGEVNEEGFETDESYRLLCSAAQSMCLLAVLPERMCFLLQQRYFLLQSFHPLHEHFSPFLLTSRQNNGRLVHKLSHILKPLSYLRFSWQFPKLYIGFEPRHFIMQGMYCPPFVFQLLNTQFAGGTFCF
jgi:hypothetical protein